MNTAPAHPQRQLTVSGLACQRGERLLFDRLDFMLSPGQALLLRGPNGAGKTSLLLCLAGVIRPLEGTIAVGGRGEDDPPDIGLLLYRNGLKPRLSVLENLTFWATVEGGDVLAIPDALEQVGLGGLDSLFAGYLSSGQTKRLALARLLLANRPIWLLDEPTAALDAEGEALVGQLIDAHLDRGGLVVAATHHDLGLADKARSSTVVLGAIR